jgi:hypothetical protein
VVSWAWSWQVAWSTSRVATRAPSARPHLTLRLAQRARNVCNAHTSRCASLSALVVLVSLRAICFAMRASRPLQCVACVTGRYMRYMTLQDVA